MVRKPKRNQQAYARLDFHPKQKGLKKLIYTARRSVRCDTRVAVPRVSHLRGRKMRDPGNEVEAHGIDGTL